MDGNGQNGQNGKNGQKRPKMAKKDPKSQQLRILTTPNLDNPESQRPRISTIPNLDDPESRRPRISSTPKLDSPKSQKPWNSTLKSEGHRGASSDFMIFFAERQLNLLVVFHLCLFLFHFQIVIVIVRDWYLKSRPVKVHNRTIFFDGMTYSNQFCGIGNWNWLYL